MEKKLKTSSDISNKRKRKLKAKVTVSETKKMKQNLPTVDMPALPVEENSVPTKNENANLEFKDIGEQFPVLKNEELIRKFLGVSMTNNQKGRIRQILKDNLKGTSELLLPDVIHHQIQTILKNSADLTDAELRKLRILYNMLKTATANNNNKVKTKLLKDDTKEKKHESKKKKELVENKETSMDVVKKEDKDDTKHIVKKKGPKRYVVFLGNLPLDVDKDKIMHHFAGISDKIKHIRIPQINEEKKSGIAYLEMKNELSYEMALSKHHSMMGSKRINVLYTLQKNSKISKTEAKGKSKKMQALQNKGVLVGSTPLNRRRSQRRKKMREAKAKLAKDT